MMKASMMAFLHLKRKKLQSTVMVLSLAIALTGSGLLLRLYQMSQTRFSSMATNVQSVVGPKCGGIEILLGALNLEDRCLSALPINLFETLKTGADIHFEDGAVISSSQLIRNVVPFLNVGKFDSTQVIATDDSFLKLLQLPKSTLFEGMPKGSDLIVGAKAAELHHLHVGQSLAIQLRNNGSSAQLIVKAILPPQDSSWDFGAFVGMETGWELLRRSGYDHPIWHHKILSFFLIQMDTKGFSQIQSLINDRSVAQMIWVDSERSELAQLSGVAGNLGLMIVIVILCLAGFSIFGMMSIRSDGLRISTATLEAIGFPQSYMFWWMTWESLMIGLLASILAMALEYASFELLKSQLDSTWLIPAHQNSNLTWVLVILGQGILFSLLGSVSSMLQLIRVSIHQELKSG